MTAVENANVALNRDRFDAEAASWDQPEHRKVAKDAADAIKRYVATIEPSAGKWKEWEVLEIGCGTGLLSEELAPDVKHLLGVDISEGMIKAFNAKKDRFPNIDAVQLLLEKEEQLQDLPYPKKFDLITSNLTLHHVGDLDAFFKLCSQLLKPNGCIAMADYEDFGSEAILFHPEKKRPGVERHGLQPEQLRQTLLGAGLRDVAVERVFSLTKEVDEKQEPMEFPFVLCTAKGANA